MLSISPVYRPHFTLIGGTCITSLIKVAYVADIRYGTERILRRISTDLFLATNNDGHKEIIKKLSRIFRCSATWYHGNGGLPLRQIIDTPVSYSQEFHYVGLISSPCNRCPFCDFPDQQKHILYILKQVRE